jgi:hypothetical protein
MTNDTRLPASREPVAELNGLTSRPWYRFFSNLFEYLGLGRGVIPATSGGTGHTSYGVGDLLYADTASTLQRLPAAPTPCYLGTDGTSMPQWIPVAYAATGDTTTQSAAANTPTVVSVNSSVYARGVSLADNKLTIEKAGLYTITTSVQLSNTSTSNDDDVTLWFRINGADLPLSASYATVVKSHGGIPGSTVLTVNIFYQFADGDELELAWLAKLGHAQIITYSSSSSPVYPAAPGVILTIAQVV